MNISQPKAVAVNSLWIAIFLALAIAVVNGFGRFAYALILPAMREDLLWDYAASGWLNTANSIGYALGGLSGMLLLTRYRSSRLFIVGLVATIACVAAVGLTRNLSWMLLWRFIAGVGSVLAALQWQGASQRRRTAGADLHRRVVRRPEPSGLQRRR